MMRSVLICHHDDDLSLDGLARWLQTWTDMVGLVVVTEPAAVVRRRVRRELRRVGALRMLDVLAYRAFHRFVHMRDDAAWRLTTLSDLVRRYPDPYSGPVLHAAAADTDKVETFLRDLAPHLVLARYKRILPERIFSIPAHGTWVMHPGICPEYRNAHGGFWALVQRDLGRVGVSLLRIDAGVDTGPVYGYFSAAFDEVSESHVVIQERSLFANLDQVADTLQRAIVGTIQPVPTAGRVSRAWGQPWLTAYLRWKWNARRRMRAP